MKKYLTRQWLEQQLDRCDDSVAAAVRRAAPAVGVKRTAKPVETMGIHGLTTRVLPRAKPAVGKLLGKPKSKPRATALKLG